MARPDASSEIVRRNNAIAQARPDLVIFGQRPDAEVAALGRYLRNVKQVSLPDQQSAEEYSCAVDQSATSAKQVSPRNIGVSLLRAKQLRYRIEIRDVGERPDNYYDSGGNLLVVCEDEKKLAQVIAANYAFSIGASLLIIARPDEQVEQRLTDALHSYGSSSSQSPSLAEVADELREMWWRPEFAKYECITFISNDLPYGISVGSVGTTHLRAYPDLGLFVIRAIFSERHDAGLVRTALMVDPKKTSAMELHAFLGRLRESGSFTRLLDGEAASGYLVDHNITQFPYGLLVISTHAGELEGDRVVYRFSDSSGKTRILEVDQVTSFSKVPGKDLFQVEVQDNFVSIDGVAWADKKGKVELGTAARDFFDYLQNDKDKLEVMSRKKVGAVRGAMGWSLSDGNFLCHPQAVAGTACPIVVNNACSSMREMAGAFLFAGARAYLGTVRPVLDVEVEQIMNQLLETQRHRALAFGLQKAQATIYGEKSIYPYIFFGCHFQSLRFGRLDSPATVADELYRSLSEHRRMLNSGKGSPRAVAGIIDFLEAEIRRFEARWLRRG